MENWEAYFYQPKPIEELIDSAVIVIDTNVLLAAYQWRELTVKEVTRALENLAEEGRLKVPEHVLYEFAKNRPREIMYRINDVEEAISRLQSPKKIKEMVPILEGKDSFKKTEELSKSYVNSLNEYKESLKGLRDDLKDLFENDPYLNAVKKIVSKSYLPNSESKSIEDLTKIANERYKLKVPPGYKDSSKDDNNAGDFIIWHSILSLKNDVIFVSGDKKEDWVYYDKKGNPVNARRELIEEFVIANPGLNFTHISPKDFITLMNPNISDEIKSDLSIQSSDSNYSSMIGVNDIEIFYQKIYSLFNKIEQSINLMNEKSNGFPEELLNEYQILSKNFNILLEYKEVFGEEDYLKKLWEIKNSLSALMIRINIVLRKNNY
ncbi:PIN-like domain-containing protein [Jeotgalibacillus sp. ET6]|uniref:PIN-like domain-containing protein n=1 Tax=Jeotgalibacillus sp. ET6 TaxID=3037260 RepID=UPI00241852A6|nr:PIN-like domain-containing protein [Jeotgalibacillus sp. ET6]MDG5470527.1 PIN-like domain-containing protein [Jeotgalibacillus sp. ET6]